jgi:peptidoglycan/LPS O-acetylase OafA/YrhL
MQTLGCSAEQGKKVTAVRHDNNFTFLRFLAATMVIVAHSHDLQGSDMVSDPLRRLTGYSMGWAGVRVFFVMSGYLILKSLLRSGSLLTFVRARVLRIFPGLAVCIVVIVFSAGLFLTTLSPHDFFTARQTIEYLAGNISLLMVKHELPGVFKDNPIHAVNGSIWTLPFEVGCYIMAALLARAGMLRSIRRRALTFAVATALAVAFIVFGPLANHITGFARLARSQELAVCFLIGMAFASFEDQFVLRWWYSAIAVFVAWSLASTAFFPLSLSVAMALLVMWLAFVPSKLLRQLSRLPDYSFGIYIYAFPVQQVLIELAPWLSPWTHSLIAFPLVLIPASLSWHFVEKPALRFKKRRSAPLPEDAAPA